MNDKHMNSEDTGQEDISGGEEASSNFRNERETYTSEKMLNDSREGPSYPISSQNISHLGKIIPQDNLFKSPQKQKQKKNRR